MLSQGDFSFTAHKDLFYIFHFMLYKQYVYVYFLLWLLI